MNKYKLTKQFKVVNGKKLYRIQALRDIPRFHVKTGDRGGFVESENNLSQKGNAWVFDNALVYDNARVYGNANVYNKARVYGDALVTDNARVYSYAQIYGDAKVSGNARVFFKKDSSLFKIIYNSNSNSLGIKIRYIL